MSSLMAWASELPGEALERIFWLGAGAVGMAILRKTDFLSRRVLSGISSRWALRSAQKEARALLKAMYLHRNPASMVAWVGERLAMLIVMLGFVGFFAWMMIAAPELPTQTGRILGQAINALTMIIFGAGMSVVLGRELELMSRMINMAAMRVKAEARMKESLIRAGIGYEKADAMVNGVLAAEPRFVRLNEDPFPALPALVDEQEKRS